MRACYRYRRLVPGPTTIDGVIDALGAIVDDARLRGDRRGLFAALYRRTTIVVRDGIEAGRFDDGARMEELDVRFAQRYLDAVAAHDGGNRPTRPWAYAFARAAEPEPALLQHLLLGVNAHISLDLAISAFETSPGTQLLDLERDFFEINRLLAEMVDEVQAELNAASPWLSALDRWGGPIDERLAASFLARARRAAWRKAVAFSASASSERPRLVAGWERQVENVSRRICPPPGHRWHPAVLLGGTEPDDVTRILATIATPPGFRG